MSLFFDNIFTKLPTSYEDFVAILLFPSMSVAFYW